jgi:hypothetical protein
MHPYLRAVGSVIMYGISIFTLPAGDQIRIAFRGTRF